MYTLNIIVKCLSVTFGCARRNIQLGQVQLDFVKLMQSWIHWCGWQQFLQRVKTTGVVPVHGGYVLETAGLRYVTLWGQRGRFWQLLLFLFLLLAWDRQRNILRAGYQTFDMCPHFVRVLGGIEAEAHLHCVIR